MVSILKAFLDLYRTDEPFVGMFMGRPPSLFSLFCVSFLFFEKREREREFCVRNNSPEGFVSMVKRN